MGKKRFAGTVKGWDHSTSADRFSNSGMEGHIRGWDTGIKVDAYADESGDLIFDVYITSGSNGGERDKHVGRSVNGEWYLIGRTL